MRAFRKKPIRQFRDALPPCVYVGSSVEATVREPHQSYEFPEARKFNHTVTDEEAKTIKDRQVGRVTDAVLALFLASVEDTLFPEIVEAIGREAAFKLLVTLRGRTITLPHEDNLGEWFKAAGVWATLSCLSDDDLNNRRSNGWRGTVAHLSQAYKVHVGKVVRWYERVDALMGGETDALKAKP